MNPPQDPPRLLDPGSDAPAWLRSSLEAGARDVADAERLARIAAGVAIVQLPISAPSAPPPPTVPPLAPVVPSLFAGPVIGAAIGVAALGVGWLAAPRSAAPRPPAHPAPIVTVMPRAPVPPRPAPAEPPAPPPPPQPERSVTMGGDPPTPLPGGIAASGASTKLQPAGGGGGSPSVATGSASAGAEPDVPASEPESAILKRAYDALRGSPAQALALTNLHLARFPGGAFAQEREVVAISALVAMGRSAEARARATRFVAAFPTSAHRRRLEVLIPDLQSSPHKNPSDPPSTP